MTNESICCATGVSTASPVCRPCRCTAGPAVVFRLWGLSAGLDLVCSCLTEFTVDLELKVKFHRKYEETTSLTPNNYSLNLRSIYPSSHISIYPPIIHPSISLSIYASMEITCAKVALIKKKNDIKKWKLAVLSLRVI